MVTQRRKVSAAWLYHAEDGVAIGQVFFSSACRLIPQGGQIRRTIKAEFNREQLENWSKAFDLLRLLRPVAALLTTVKKNRKYQCKKSFAVSTNIVRTS